METVKKSKIAWASLVKWIFLVILIIFFGLTSDVFFSVTNLLNIITQISMTGIIALGMTYVIITGGIDLSSGSVLAFVGCIVAIMSSSGINDVVCVAAGLLAGALCGFLNGVVSTKGKIPPFIVTFGMMSICRGMALIITKAQIIVGISPSLTGFFNRRFFGLLQFQALSFVVLFLIVLFMEKKLPFFRYVYAVGDNENSARLSGIPVDRVKIIVYTMIGALTAYSSMLFISRIGSGDPNMGADYEFTAIGAVVMGGTSLSGGRGTVATTLLGTLIFGVLNNGFNLLGVNSDWQKVFRGLIIILAVLLNSLSDESNRRK